MKFSRKKRSFRSKDVFKNRKLSKFTFLVLFLTLSSLYSQAQQGHFKIRNDEFIQIGYDNYKTLSFGIGGSSTMPNNGMWALEHWNGGFNFWRPWPQYNWGNYKMFIKDYDGWVGIGKYPLHQLDVNGDIATFGSVQVTSDARLKTNVTNLNSENCLSSLMQVQSITYNYKYDRFPYQGPTPEGDLTETKQKTIQPFAEDTGEAQSKILRHGFLAQDLKEIFPDLVKQDEAGFYSIDYMGMIPIVVESVKEQQNKINKLEAKLAELEQIIQRLDK